jgi:hypothetical protein
MSSLAPSRWRSENTKTGSADTSQNPSDRQSGPNAVRNNLRQVVRDDSRFDTKVNLTYIGAYGFSVENTTPDRLARQVAHE